MATNIILESQQTYGNLNKNKANVFSPLMGAESVKASYPIAQDVVDSEALATASFNAYVEHNISRDIAHKDEVFLISTGAGTATSVWADYVGLMFFSQMALNNGSADILTWDPTVVWSCVLPTLDTQLQALILQSAGGTSLSSASAQVLAVPVILPWSSLNQPINDLSSLFLAFVSGQQMRLRSQINSQAILTNSAATPSLNIKFRQYGVFLNAETKKLCVERALSGAGYAYTCKLWNCYHDSTTFPTATSQSFKLNSWNGNLQDMFAYVNVATDLTSSPANLMKIYPLTGSSVTINSQTIFNMNNVISANVMDLNAYFLSGVKGVSATANKNPSVVFSANCYNDIVSAFGYLNNGSVTTVGLTAQHASGADSKLSVGYQSIGRLVLDNGVFILDTA